MRITPQKAAQSSVVCSASWKTRNLLVSIWPWQSETHQVGGTRTLWCLKKSILDSAKSIKMVGLPCSFKHLFHSYFLSSPMCKGLCWERMAGKIQEEAATPSEKGLRLQRAQQAGEIYRRLLWLKGRQPRRMSLEEPGVGMKRGRPGRPSHKRLYWNVFSSNKLSELCFQKIILAAPCTDHN